MEQIKLLRKKLGLSQDEFATQLGLSRNFVWMLEKGEREPSERTINDICRIFNVNPAWLRTGEGEMYLAPTREDEIAEMTARMFKADDSDYWYQLGKILKDVDDEHMEALFNIAKEWVEEVTKAKQAKEAAAAPTEK
jgi:transcriptional regulator with XRE-family HTH domain